MLSAISMAQFAYIERKVAEAQKEVDDLTRQSAEIDRKLLMASRRLLRIATFSPTSLPSLVQNAWRLGARARSANQE